jgi:membrane-bound lytic murein transglycosylase
MIATAVLSLILAAAMMGCEQGPPEPNETGKEQMERQEYLDMQQQRLEGFEGQIESMKEYAEQPGARPGLAATAQRLEERLETVRPKFEALQSASDASFEEAKNEWEKAAQQMEEALEKAR